MESLAIERHESVLGAWLQASWAPPAGTELHGSVHHIWYFDGVLIARRQRVFPDGSIEIIVQLDEPHAPDGGAAAVERFPAVCLTGLRLTSEIVVAPPGRSRVLGLVISPPCAHVLTRASLASLTGITADLHDIIGRGAAELAERVREAPEPAVAIAAARDWLSERIRRPGGAKAGFREAFGTTPKRYRRILRFRAALDALVRGRSSLADIAATYGYYDQAHFTNEFREHAGMTPTVYLRTNGFPGGTSVTDG